MKSSEIGGQAVIEGVMMKNKNKYAVAVRKSDGDIVVDVQTIKKQRTGILKAPIIRGVVAFVDSMVIGIKTLSYSASFFEDEEEKKDSIKANSAAENKEEAEEAAAIEEKKTSTSDKALIAGTVALSILFSVAIFMLLPMFLSRLLQNVIENTMILALIEGGLRILIFVGYVLVISQMNDIKRVFSYHGAEHKSINCIENGLDLTVENVRGQSCQHKRCGTSFMLFVIFISLIFFLFIRVDQVWLQALIRVLLVPVIAGISYEIIRFAGKSDNKLVAAISKPGFAMQKLTTREPDDSMIEVAIASVEAVYDWKPFVEKLRANDEAEFACAVEKKQGAGKQIKRAEQGAGIQPKKQKQGTKKVEQSAKETNGQKTKIAEQKAIQAKQKTKAAEQKAVEAEQKANEKELKAREAEQIAKEAEQIAKEAEQKEKEIEAQKIREAEQQKAEAIRLEEARKAAEVNLDTLDVLLTSSVQEEPIEFHDPYENRPVPKMSDSNDEDDDILKALDKFFVMDEENEA